MAGNVRTSDISVLDAHRAEPGQSLPLAEIFSDKPEPVREDQRQQQMQQQQQTLG